MKIFILLLFFCISCSNDNFQKVEALNAFRVLGIVASSPEVAPGGTSELRLLISDINGGGRTINVSRESCIDPGISLGAPVSCDHDPGTESEDFVIDTDDTGDADLGAANLYTGLTDALTITVPATILLGRSAREQFNGVGYITIFRITVDGKEVVAFKRILATTRGSLNTNPTITDIFSNEASITTKPAKDSALLAQTGPPESYSYLTVAGETETRTENYQAAWYFSSGEVDKPKSASNETVKYLSDPGSSPFLLLVLLRDERGGLTYRREIYP